MFELIQVAIGSRSTLSCPLKEDEWGELRLLFKKQGMLGVGYVGITKLPQEQCPPIQVLAQWVHNAEKIRKKNQKVTEVCRQVCEQLEHDGFDTVVLKGQSNLVNYRPSISPFHSTGSGQVKGDFPNLSDYRTPGDIDVLCIPKGPIEVAVGNGNEAHYEKYEGKQAVIEYVRAQCRTQGMPEPQVRYHHIDLPTFDVPVEVHFKASYFNCPWHNKFFQNWVQEVSAFHFNNAQYRRQVSRPEELPIPTNSFNAVYQLVHIYRHLFCEGIGLRQLLDYYFVLRALHIEQGEHSDRTHSMAMWAHSTYSGQASGLGRSVYSNAQVMHYLESFGMKRFAGAVMWVLQEVFAMPNVFLLCPPDEKAGRFVLDEIMRSGNFGMYDDRNEALRNASKAKRFFLLTFRNFRFFTQYPTEVIFDPWRRLVAWVMNKRY